MAPARFRGYCWGGPLNGRALEHENPFVRVPRYPVIKPGLRPALERVEPPAIPVDTYEWQATGGGFGRWVIQTEESTADA